MISRSITAFALVGCYCLTLSFLEAQAVKPSSSPVKEKIWDGKDKGIIGYKVTRKSGYQFEVESVVEKAPFYNFVDRDGKKSWNVIDSVERIEPIRDPEFGKTQSVATPPQAPVVVTPLDNPSPLPKEPSAGGSISDVSGTSHDIESSRTEPRISARSLPRTKARTSANRAYRSTLPGSDFVDQSQSNVGYTATGIPLNIGPRGGVYHMSSGGNQVYQRHK